MARRYLGVPFRHRGRNRAGLDCAGLIVCTLRDLGLMPANYIEHRYARTPHQGLVEDTLEQCCSRIDHHQSGDILLLSFLHNPCHVAFYTEGAIIHAYEERGKVIEENYDAKWARRFVGAFRVRNERG